MNGELNKKRAEWAGFVKDKSGNVLWVGSADYVYPECVWIEPTESKRVTLPDFPESLDACFKWLVPKAVELLKGDDHKFFGWKRLFDSWQSKLPYDGTNPALALCLAIDKLIGSV